MSTINLVVMGKTGAGKSTLINAVLEEDLAPTGSGQAVTHKNHLYTKKMLLPRDKRTTDDGRYGLVSKTLNLYDTVGLEIDSTITQSTLHEIKSFITRAQRNENQSDLSLVWFCVNCRSNRFEPYEIELIRSLSIEHEIPFLVVLTQCYSDEQGNLERKIREDFPEIPIARVLAKEYRLRNGIIPANGVTELILTSILEYDRTKVHILESKLDKLSFDRGKRIEKLRAVGKEGVDSYANKAGKIGFVPGGCIPIVHGMCISMVSSLNKIVGINSSKDFSSDIFANVLTGIVVTPFLVVPFLSAAVAYSYVAAIGESYLDSLMCVISRSTDRELRDNELMAERIKAELKKRTK